jgi:hypothetical protein
MMTKGAAAKAAGEAIRSYGAQREALTVERDRVDRALQRLRQESATALERTVSTLLPHVRPDLLARLDLCLPQLRLVQRREEKEREAPSRASRRREIEADPDFCQKDALLSKHGELGDAVEELMTSLERAKIRHEDFEACSTFLFAYGRQQEEAQGRSAFQTFWRAITFSATRESMARKSSCEKFRHSDWESVVREYEQVQRELAEAGPHLEQMQARRRRLLALRSEHQELQCWESDFEGQLKVHLGRVVSETLAVSPLADLCAKVKGRAALAVATFDALRAKCQYLESLFAYLDCEVGDRGKRISKLNMVKSRWERKSYSMMSDKTKWLVTVPAIKATSSEKCCRWSRRLLENLESYQDYESYAAYLAAIPEMLPYDAFAYGCSESMPYEGFARQVIPALDKHRKAQGQSKADYAPFKKVDKERGAKAREPEEEGGTFEHSTDRDEDRDDDPFAEEAVAFAAVGGAAYAAHSSSSEFGDLS